MSPTSELLLLKVARVLLEETCRQHTLLTELDTQISHIENDPNPMTQQLRAQRAPDNNASFNSTNELPKTGACRLCGRPDVELTPVVTPYVNIAVCETCCLLVASHRRFFLENQPPAQHQTESKPAETKANLPESQRPQP